MAHRPTSIKALSPTALSTTAATAWDPGSGTAILLYAACLGQTAAVGTPLVVHLKAGTTAAAGTIATMVLAGSFSGPTYQSFGAGIKVAGISTLLGIRTNMGAGTVAGYFEGRLQKF